MLTPGSTAFEYLSNEWFDALDQRLHGLSSRSADTVEIVQSTAANGTIIHSRFWADSELIAWGAGQPAHISDNVRVFETHWASLTNESRYWNAADIPLAPTTIRSLHPSPFEPSIEWFVEHQPARDFPGATMTVDIGLDGLALDPKASAWMSASISDGRTSARSATAPDLTIGGPAPMMLGFMAGQRPFDLGLCTSLDGDMLLIACIQGLLQMAGGLEIPSATVGVVRELTDLVMDHRDLADQLL